MIKRKLKELWSELEKFKIQAMLLLDHKKRSDWKIFHPSTEITASNSDNDEAFISMHESSMTKI